MIPARHARIRSRLPRCPRGGFALIAVLGAIIFVSAMLAIIIVSLTTQFAELNRRAETLQQDHLMRAAAERVWSRSTMEPEHKTLVWTPDPAVACALHAAIEADQVVEVKLQPTSASTFTRAQRFRIEEGHASPL